MNDEIIIELTPELKKDLFKLCIKTSLKSYEKELLIHAPTDLHNKQYETLIHNYIKNTGYDFDLLNKLLENQHSLQNINKKDETILESLFQSRNNMIRGYKSMSESGNRVINLFSLKPKKIMWLLTNGVPCDLSKHGKQITEILLLDRYKMTKEEFGEFKMLFQNGKITHTNLTTYTNFYPELFCTSVDMLEWFNSNFQINWAAFNPCSISHNNVPSSANLLHFHFISHHLNRISNLNYLYSLTRKRKLSAALTPTFDFKPHYLEFQKMISWLQNKNYVLYPSTFALHQYNFIANQVLKTSNLNLLKLF